MGNSFGEFNFTAQDPTVLIQEAVSKKLDSMIFLVERNEKYISETRDHITVDDQKKKRVKKGKETALEGEESAPFIPSISVKEFQKLESIYGEKQKKQLEQYRTQFAKIGLKAKGLKLQKVNSVLDRTNMDLEEEYGFYRDMVQIITADFTNVQNGTFYEQKFNMLKAELLKNRQELEDDFSQLKSAMHSIK